MKTKFLLFVSLLLTANVFAQLVPCPEIVNVTYQTESVGPCIAYLDLTVVNEVGAPKSFRVQVFNRRDTTAVPLSDKCYTVPGGDTTTTFSSDRFPCADTVTLVITRFTASNGECQGASCSRTLVIPGTPGVVLPVTLTSFTANRTGGMVSLKWTSESETNFRSYQIEMNDGSGFRTVGTVLAKNNGIANDYSFETTYASKGSVTYRLKMIDLDGAFAYSKTALVKGDNLSFDFNIYPNPGTSANTNILVSGLMNSGRIQIIDMTGKVLKTLVVNNTNVKVGNLPTGVYMVKLSNTATSEQVTKRLVIVN